MDWWNSLRHGGLLIAPSRLQEYFAAPPEPLPQHVADRLRRELTRFEADPKQNRLIPTVLEDVCGLGGMNGGGGWLAGADLDSAWSHQAVTGERVRPRRVWTGHQDAALPVFVTDEPRIGIGRGRRDLARTIEWLRGQDRKLALLTNGVQWRLMYAGLDHDAWAEWDSELWFEEGRPGPQIDALRALLSPRALNPPSEGEPAPLLAAIAATRQGQAELSAELGERVRQAVELLIQEHGSRLQLLLGSVSERDVYLAATRIVMRMVVVLFAEARELLPRDNAVYHGSYGLQGLREELDRVGGGEAGRERLRHRFAAWPRVLALFRLVYEGSHHPSLTILRYGGGLFEPGVSDAPDPIARALAVFEDPSGAAVPSDATLARILALLCRSRVKVRQGRASTWIEAPVDFSDLSSEYIGILYEGLLDFELRRAGPGDPILFLALGDEPALPLSRLEAMSDKALSDIVAQLHKGSASSRLDSGDESGGEEEEEAEAEESDVEGDADLVDDAQAEEFAGLEAREDAEAEEAELSDAEHDDLRHEARMRAWAWAERAVVAGRLVAKPRGRRQSASHQYEEAVRAAARKLVRRVILPGEWYLVRWGGTRKGAGTFYTRPQLAVPTAMRTLLPLACEPPPRAEGGPPDEDAPPARWTPRRPEEILALKVCDPGMGSGSFLVASLRFLTDTLFAALHHHGRIAKQGDQTLVTLAEGKPTEGRLVEELLPCPPDAEDFEPRLRARLKRYVVERCIYGVDLDPLAVELGRLALWVETMDRSLPFEFLDHKLKVGNSLVGCWFDRFQDYPDLAWDREGGDKNHTTGVHYAKEAWTRAIKQFRANRVKEAVAQWIRGEAQLTFFEGAAGAKPAAVHAAALAAFDELNAIPVHEPERRAECYRARVLANPAFAALREAFDAWCAIWFWPADRLEEAPLPSEFAGLPEATRALVHELAREHRFFHWELEFPDVFTAPGGGFDAVVGNPPWETQKPVSKEFFSNIDPLYRTYGKQEALGYQKKYFAADTAHESDWLRYNARFKALSNWVKYASAPFGGDDSEKGFPLGRGSAELHRLWASRRRARRGYADAEHPFRHQGSADINTYKLFLEQSHALLRPAGRLGMIVPSGVYTDKGSTELRRLLLERCQWQWLFGFENRRGIFDIHRSFKFNPLIVRKAGRTQYVRAAFMRHDLAEWEVAEPRTVAYGAKQIERFSPFNLALLEVQERRDLEILEKIYANSVLLGDQGPDGWGIEYSREFDMANDSHLFPPRPVWEAKGYKPDPYGRWIGPDGDVALPLYQGVMIWQYDFAARGYLQGSGLRARWGSDTWCEKVPQGQYIMRHLDVEAACPDALSYKIVHRRVQNATNQRTMIATLVPGFPCGDTVARIKPFVRHRDFLMLAALNAFICDAVTRSKVSQNHVDLHYIIDVPLPSTELPPCMCECVRRLAMPSVLFAPMWLHVDRSSAWRRTWAVTDAERLRIRCILDAAVSELFGLEWEDLAWILSACDYPRETVRAGASARLFTPKGFWRVDRDRDPELRHTVLTLAALADLKKAIHSEGESKALELFCGRGPEDGWQLPETLCLADLGLGHDDRAKKPQPVRARLGERFLPWQLEQSVEDSWAECERHARNILGDAGFDRVMEGVQGRRSKVQGGEGGVQGRDCGVQSPRSKVQGRGGEVQGPTSNVQGREEGRGGTGERDRVQGELF